jgi:vancomycin resistance protein YoaR
VRARIVRSRKGVGVEPSATAGAILRAGMAGRPRVAKLTLGPVDPALTSAEAKKLGIKRKLVTVTTDLGASSPNRVFNVALMARILDRQVIKPGQRFSFNARVGPRSPQRGFREGQAIVNGLLLPSIGGGVCQVATTVYDAAFYAGLPINERHNHAWYISHYSLGMDATVADGGPDLVFRNDTGYGILIRAASNASTMTVTLYSTPTGISVEKKTGPQYGFDRPKSRYILNPSLKGDASSQRTSGAQGFSVEVTRIVRRRGKVIRRDSFASRYVPESVLYVVGPEFTPPEPDATVEKAPPAFSF